MRKDSGWRSALCVLIASFSLIEISVWPANAQPVSADPAPASLEDDPFNVGDSSVGYIDNAIPGNQLRLRYDAAYFSRIPSRGEFLWAAPAFAGGPGVAMPERWHDDQDITTYLELSPVKGFSAFVEGGIRFVNPEVNDNSAGMSDMNAGFKIALLRTCDMVATLQFRAYIPTGDAERALGVDHVSLEPSLLLYKRLSDRMTFEGELRYWIPVGGTPTFAGELIRYGAGIGYNVVETCNWKITPIAEFVGWTLLDGRKTVVTGGQVALEDADGDTIVNGKFGVRTRYQDRHQLFLGYGRALTGERWYRDIFRVEYRLSF